MGKTVAICQVGGKFEENKNGSLAYAGGEAYAIPVFPSMSFDDFKAAIAEICNHDMSNTSIKYFLPSNRKTPITVSNDKHMQCMLDFHEDSPTIDVFLLVGEATPQKTVTTVENRGSRATSGITNGAVNGTVSRSVTSNKRRTSATDSALTPVTLNDNSAKSSSTVLDLTTPNAATPTSGGDSVATRNRRIASAEPITPIATIFTELSHDERPEQFSSTGSIISDVGQEFSSVHEFRDALRRYAIAEGFVCVYIKNDCARVTAKCKAEGCLWRVHASKLAALQKFKIKTMNKVHTCGCRVGKEGHPFATRLWVASIIKDKLQERPQYTPKEIIDDICQEYGVRLTYQQAWSGKEVAQDQLQKSRAEAYTRLPWYCERVRETNPGSTITLATTEDSRFQRFFFSFHASLHGFENGCRPLILLDGTSLREKCRGALLTAASVDGEDGIFPLAFAIVDSESYDDWQWFLIELKSALQTNQVITFVSSTHNGLEEAVPQVFEDCHHAYSLHHLIEDFKQVLRGPSQMVKDALVDEFKRAAYTCTINSFNACIENIRNVSQDAAMWVLDSKPDHWSSAFFRGLRYDHVSSDIAELFYAWIPEAQQLSIIQTVDIIRGKVMETIHARREMSNTWSTILTPSYEQKLQLQICNSHSLSVLCSSGNVFEVRDDAINIVNIETWACTCQRWKLSGLPCVHAAAVFDRTGSNVYSYCSSYFTVDCYRAAYSESIHPVADVEQPENQDSENQIVVVRPPRTHRPHRPRGRPKSNQTVASRKKVRLHHCSNCGGEGHNKKRCKSTECQHHLC